MADVIKEGEKCHLKFIFSRSNMNFVVEEEYEEQPYHQPSIGRTVFKIVYNINHNITGSFTIDEVEDEIHQVFRRIVESAFTRVQGNQMVSIEIEPFGEMPNGSYSLYMGYFHRNDFDERLFMAKLSQISQSNEEFFLSGLLTAKVAVITPVRIGGRIGRLFRGPKRTDDFFLSKKKTLHKVRPDNDYSCGFWCVALGMKYHEFHGKITNQEEWRRFRENRHDCLKNEAKDLCRKCGIRYNDTICDFDHISIMNEYLRNKGFQLVVIQRPPAQRVGQVLTPMFPKPLVLDPKLTPIGIEYEPSVPYGHCNFISSFASYFGKEYFCVRCWKPDRSKQRHRCKARCLACNYEVPCLEDKLNGRILCEKCGVLCMDADCLSSHQKNGMCEKRQKHQCSNCFKFMKNEEKDGHRCFFQSCTKCKITYQIQPHYCYVTPIDVAKLKIDDKIHKIFVFFDTETRQDKVLREKVFQHVPTLIVAHIVCDRCLNTSNMTKDIDDCSYCGTLEHVFEGDDIAGKFGDFLYDEFADRISSMAQAQKAPIRILVYAHNLMRFDGKFVLEDLWKRRYSGIFPLLNGRKIMMIKFNNVKIVDSLSLFQQPLSSLPKSFGFSDIVKKGFFPYLADTKANANRGDVKMPPIDDFGVKWMKSGKAEEIRAWHRDHANDKFNLEKDRLEYCRSDVKVLMRAVLTYRQSFQSITGIDPLSRKFTLPSICLEYFRTNLQEKKIGVTPINGYISCTSSNVCNAWLDLMERKTDTKIHREQRLGMFICDGINYDKKVVYEYWGCLFHGCNHCVTDKQLIFMGITREKLHKRVVEKQMFYEKNGYDLVERWEHELWDEEEEEYIKKRTKEWKQIKISTDGGLKKALFGGRVNFTRLRHTCESNEKIKYYDFNSLYPKCLWDHKYPTGHPRVISDDIEDITLEHFPYFGFICCTVLPPAGLNLPVLPSKVDGKLFFTLCCSCSRERNKDKGEECDHNDKQRAISGTWTTAELYLSLQKGYKIIKVFVVYQFDTSDRELFKDYLRTWIKVKQEASGWPRSTLGETEEETDVKQDEYLEKWNSVYGIKLEKNRIEFNAAKRSLAKLKLNSLWGMFTSI